MGHEMLRALGAGFAALSLSACVIVDVQEVRRAPQAAEKPSETRRNVILMISDGAGFNGWLAADYYQGLAGQQAYQLTRPDGTRPLMLGLSHDALNLIDAHGNVLPRTTEASQAAGAVRQGYDPLQRWRQFENAMLNDFEPVGETYTSYTDSAAAGTALMAGRKTTVGRVNIDWTGTQRFRTIAERAMDRGLATGSVSSVMASHATPAAVIAHNTSRNNYEAIFNEMVTSGLDVIMGGGHPLYDESGNARVEITARDYRYLGGEETFTALQSESGLNGYTFLDHVDAFAELADGRWVPDRVVGIARTGSTLQADREELPAGETVSGMAFNPAVPDLATMSVGALNVLDQHEDGFFVMIEGGAVDWMGHANNMPRFIEEQVDFNLAVEAVIAWVEANSSWDETLLIVTSDHETGGIWGEGSWTNSQGGPVATDRSSQALEAARFDPSEDAFNAFLAVQDRGAGVLPGFQWASRNHTNDLVPLWAMGVGADRFLEFTRTDPRAGTLWGEPYGWNGDFVENTAVFHVMDSVVSGN